MTQLESMMESIAITGDEATLQSYEDFFEEYLLESDDPDGDIELGYICRYCLVNPAEEEWGACKDTACQILMGEYYPEAYMGRFE